MRESDDTFLEEVDECICVLDSVHQYIEYGATKTENTTLRFAISYLAWQELARLIKDDVSTFARINKESSTFEPVCRAWGKWESEPKIGTLHDWLTLTVQDAIRLLGRSDEGQQEPKYRHDNTYPMLTQWHLPSTFRNMILAFLTDVAETIENTHSQLATKIRWVLTDEKNSGTPFPITIDINDFLWDSLDEYYEREDREIETSPEEYETFLAMKYMAASEISKRIPSNRDSLDPITLVEILKDVAPKANIYTSGTHDILNVFFHHFRYSLHLYSELACTTDYTKNFWGDIAFRDDTTLANAMTIDMITFLTAHFSNESMEFFRLWSGHHKPEETPKSFLFAELLEHRDQSFTSPDLLTRFKPRFTRSEIKIALKELCDKDLIEHFHDVDDQDKEVVRYYCPNTEGYHEYLSGNIR